MDSKSVTFFFRPSRTGTIPEEMGNFTALTRLWLNGNNLEGENRKI